MRYGATDAKTNLQWVQGEITMREMPFRVQIDAKTRHSPSLTHAIGVAEGAVLAGAEEVQILNDEEINDND